MDMSDFSMRRLHPLLQSQLRELRARVTGGRVSAHELLEMLSRYYDSIDDERRAMVRSMQLMSDEARSLGVEIAEQGAAQLQVILDHIKDVVITVDAAGVIDRANPMAERVFAYASGELSGQSIDALVPGIALDGSIAAGLDQVDRIQRHVPRHAPEPGGRRAPQRRLAIPGGNCCKPRRIRARRSVRHLPARHLRKAQHAGSAARQRGALSLAGRPRAGSHHRHRSGLAGVSSRRTSRRCACSR